MADTREPSAAPVPAPPAEPTRDLLREMVAAWRSKWPRADVIPLAEIELYAANLAPVPAPPAEPTCPECGDTSYLVDGDVCIRHGPLYAAPAAEPVAQPACDHDWRDRRTSNDPHALDTCCRCGAVRGEDEPVAQQPPPLLCKTPEEIGAALDWIATQPDIPEQPEAPQAELTPRVDALLLETNEGRRYATEGPLATLARNLEAANARLIRDANTSNRLIGERCEQLEAELAASREREQALREALQWYGEKATALQRYASAKPPKDQAMMAVVTELTLDAGARAKIATPDDCPLTAPIRPTTLASLYGWICPRCQKVHAPSALTCDRCMTTYINLGLTP